MELLVQEIPKIEPIKFNFDELRSELEVALKDYKTIAYTAETIKEAKADRAKLNKLRASLNDERLRLEKEYMEPFLDFKSKVSLLCGMVDEAAKAIDVQVKEYEEAQKEKKRAEIGELFQTTFPQELSWVSITQIWNDKWLNASYKMTQIAKDMEGLADKITMDMAMLDRLPEYSFEAKETYKRSLRVEDAMWQADHLTQMAVAKHKEEEERRQKTQNQPPQAAIAEPTQEEAQNYMEPPTAPDLAESASQKQALCFRVFVDMEEAVKLSTFLKDNGIRFERI